MWNLMWFIESPYKKVESGVVQDKVEYLSAMEETKFTIAQANAKLDKNGKILSLIQRSRNKIFTAESFFFYYHFPF